MGGLISRLSIIQELWKQIRDLRNNISRIIDLLDGHGYLAERQLVVQNLALNQQEGLRNRVYELEERVNFLAGLHLQPEEAAGDAQQQFGRVQCQNCGTDLSQNYLRCHQRLHCHRRRQSRNGRVGA